jgi:hypothetical protein
MDTGKKWTSPAWILMIVRIRSYHELRGKKPCFGILSPVRLPFRHTGGEQSLRVKFTRTEVCPLQQSNLGRREPCFGSNPLAGAIKKQVREPAFLKS